MQKKSKYKLVPLFVDPSIVDNWWDFKQKITIKSNMKLIKKYKWTKYTQDKKYELICKHYNKIEIRKLKLKQAKCPHNFLIQVCIDSEFSEYSDKNHWKCEECGKKFTPKQAIGHYSYDFNGDATKIKYV